VAAFRPDVCRDSEQVEYFTFGHAVVDDFARPSNQSDL
jgi:hypothetical protein